MSASELLEDAFDRIHDTVHSVAEDLGAQELAFRPGPEANSIGWLIWHLTRVQDDHVSEVAGRPQSWTSDGWFERFALPLDAADTGYAHSSDEVAAVKIESAKLLTGYFDAVHEQTLAFVRGISEADLQRVVDTRWDPPVALSARLISVINDDMEHAGQAAYVAGLLPRA